MSLREMFLFDCIHLNVNVLLQEGEASPFAFSSRCLFGPVGSGRKLQVAVIDFNIDAAIQD